MKQCNKCRLFKKFEKFSQNIATKDGFQGMCKECAKLDCAARKLTNPNYFANWYQANKDTVKIAQDEYGSTTKGFFVARKAGAKARGFEWKLSETQFSYLVSESCFVTGCADEVTGLDRLDCLKGYTFDNVRASCERHNE